MERFVLGALALTAFLIALAFALPVPSDPCSVNGVAFMSARCR